MLKANFITMLTIQMQNLCVFDCMNELTHRTLWCMQKMSVKIFSNARVKMQVEISYKNYLYCQNVINCKYNQTETFDWKEKNPITQESTTRFIHYGRWSTTDCRLDLIFFISIYWWLSIGLGCKEQYPKFSFRLRF